MDSSKKPNHLINEPSRYLQEHAHQPVDWYPWCEEALAKARRENKPILLSIGYAACHWCHVMAHESFEDIETARLMNQWFVNIKVDREERPDIDKVCQTAHGLLTQRSGGWPLTVFLTPDDRVPFFCGTYFPLQARYNLPAFKYVLRNIADLYQNHHAEIKAQNEELKHVLRDEHTIDTTTIVLDESPSDAAKKILRSSFDAKNGGFGKAPKFPQAITLEFLLDEKEIIETTLNKMAEGGINDQLSGGFFRYSVDAAWQVPHFEKMLYDNAQLLKIYAQAFTIHGNTLFSNTAKMLGHWLLKALKAPESVFYASIDADSEGQEGKYYLWNKFEIKNLLTIQEGAIINLYFGLERPPNFEKQWHLYIARPLEEIATQLKIPLETAHDLLNSAKIKLLMAREARPFPAYDKKILTAWNALVIEALLQAGTRLGLPEFIKAAQQGLAFLYQKLWINGKLFASYQNNQARLSAYLDDYAFLLSAVLTSLSHTWSTPYCQFAIDLAEVLLNDFADKKNGGFYFTSVEHEKLTHRPKSITDEALPAGNGVVTAALIKLGHLLGEPRYLLAAERTLMSAWEILLRYPAEHCSLLLALKNYLNPPTLVIIRGPRASIKAWAEECQSYLQLDVFAVPNEERALPGHLTNYAPSERPTAFVCKGHHCEGPIDELNQLHKILRVDA